MHQRLSLHFLTVDNLIVCNAVLFEGNFYNCDKCNPMSFRTFHKFSSYGFLKSVDFLGNRSRSYFSAESIVRRYILSRDKKKTFYNIHTLSVDNFCFILSSYYCFVHQVFSPSSSSYSQRAGLRIN